MSQEAVATCRNSVQGREIIADDRGYICDRSELLASGCCDANSSTAGRFLCTSCDQVQSLLGNATLIDLKLIPPISPTPQGGCLLWLL